MVNVGFHVIWRLPVRAWTSFPSVKAKRPSLKETKKRKNMLFLFHFWVSSVVSKKYIYSIPDNNDISAKYQLCIFTCSKYKMFLLQKICKSLISSYNNCTIKASHCGIRLHNCNKSRQEKTQCMYFESHHYVVVLSK